MYSTYVLFSVVHTKRITAFYHAASPQYFSNAILFRIGLLGLSIWFVYFVFAPLHVCKAGTLINILIEFECITENTTF